MPLHIATPLVESRPLGAAAGRRIRLKLESLQPGGSFKTRGIGAACEARAADGARRFVSSSGGNAGIAVADTGRRLGVPVTVVVPASTTSRAIERMRLDGAEVIVHGATWLEAHARARAMAGPTDALIHPFDDPLIWDGHATLVDEIAAAGSSAKPDAIVCTVGGGGLYCGIVEGLRRNGWGDVPVIAVETDGAASLHRSIVAGERVMLESIDSIATSLGAKQVCERAYELANEHATTSVVVGDASAVRACLRFIDDHALVVEPACGAALALAYEGHPSIGPYRDVVIVVCGGTTATVGQLMEWGREPGSSSVVPAKAGTP